MLSITTKNWPKTALFMPLLAFCFVQCKNEATSTTATPANAPVLAHNTYAKTEGDCNTRCARFSVAYPTVSEGTPALRDSIQRWVTQSVAAMSAQGEEGTAPNLKLEESASAFIEAFKGYDGIGPYEFEAKDTILMANAQYVAIRLDMYIFTGGAHPNTFAQLAVFDSNTGALVPTKAFIKDEKAILPLLDLAYRAEKQEAFAEGVPYMDSTIVFPTQCAFTEKGVLFHYNTYEIAAYAVGDADIFMTWTDLGQSASNPIK
jgi:hypothetical protein